MDKIEIAAEALFLHDRDLPRPFDVLGYSKLMYGTPPCAWGDLCEVTKNIFREQAKAVLTALSK